MPRRSHRNALMRHHHSTHKSLRLCASVDARVCVCVCQHTDDVRVRADACHVTEDGVPRGHFHLRAKQRTRLQGHVPACRNTGHTGAHTYADIRTHGISNQGTQKHGYTATAQARKVKEKQSTHTQNADTQCKPTSSTLTNHDQPSPQWTRRHANARERPNTHTQQQSHTKGTRQQCVCARTMTSRSSSCRCRPGTAARAG